MKERKTENPRRGEADGHGEASPVLLLFSGILFAFAFAAEHLFRLPAPLCAALYLLPYLLSGFGCIKEAVSGIFHGDIFGEEFLMTAASVGAFCVGSFAEGAAVMLLFSLGEFFEELAVGKTRSSVRALMAIRPETAHVRTADGSVSDAAPETVPVGAVIEVRAGERVPLDGIVLSGAADLDTAALTGESVPRPAAVGDTVCSGCICTNGVLTVRTAKTAGDSAAARILALTETETSRKTRAESFLSRFSEIYTPLVVGAAVLLAVIPPLVTGAWSVWIHRALTFLVVSCPCALVISVPLTFFCGIGAASSMGVLIKGSAALETLSRVSVVASDKTGTLTEGKLRVTSVSGKNENRLLFLTAHAEVFSAHPAARAILSAYETAVGKKPDARLASGTTETAGRGVSAVVSENGTPVRVLAGNAAWMAENGVRCDSAEGSVIHAAAKTDGAYEYLGCIRVADTLKKDAVTAVSSFRACGVREIHMLTGDTEAAAKPVSDALGLDGCHAGLFPEEKLKTAHSLRKKAASSGGCLLCVGDGINDAPFLAAADVGAAMGALGSDAAMEAADIVVMDDMPSKLPRAMRLSGKTVGIARENIIFAVSVKVLILLLGAFGYAGMWAAVFGDVGVTLLCIANAARAAIRRY